MMKITEFAGFVCITNQTTEVNKLYMFCYIYIGYITLQGYIATI